MKKFPKKCKTIQSCGAAAYPVRLPKMVSWPPLRTPAFMGSKSWNETRNRGARCRGSSFARSRSKRSKENRANVSSATKPSFIAGHSTKYSTTTITEWNAAGATRFAIRLTISTGKRPIASSSNSSTRSSRCLWLRQSRSIVRERHSAIRRKRKARITTLQPRRTANAATAAVAAGSKMNRFAQKLAEHSISLSRGRPEILQVNVGKLCNLTCMHCHVNAGPKRKEIMARKTIDRIIDWLARTNVPTVDLTGGAPEMIPDFRYFIEQVKSLLPSRHVIDRCNLTILVEGGYEDLASFLARNKVE